MTQCIIYAKTDHTTDIWRYIDETSQISARLVDKQSSGYGYFISKDTVLTCKHVIQRRDNSNAYCYIKNDMSILRRSLTLISEIHGYDIVLMSTNGKSIHRDMTTECISLKNLIKYKNGNILVSTIDIDKSNIIQSNIRCNILSVEFCHLKSTILPKIPIIKISIDNFENPEGLSGSLLTINNRPAGIIVSYMNQMIEAIPMQIIKMMVNRLQNISPKGLYLNVSNIKARFDGNPISGLYLKTTSPQYYRHESIKNIIFSFKQGDIITHIDNTQIIDGMMFSHELGIDIWFDTYMLLKQAKTLSIKYITQDRDSQYIPKEIIISPREYESTVKININMNHNYHYYKGLVFSELSEEFIRYHALQGINLVGDIYEHYDSITIPEVKVSKYDNEKKPKIIILIDVNYQDPSLKKPDELKKYGLPLVSYKNGYVFPVLTKIESKKIDSLQNLHTMLNDHDAVRLTFKLDTKTYIRFDL